MENIKFYYYNDQDATDKIDPPSGNCTYGMGHLVHQGPCGDKFRKPVSKEEVYKTMVKDVINAENIVKNNITHVKLNQAKFDGLVCFTFSEGRKPLLSIINDGADDEVVVDKLLQYNKAFNRKTGEYEEGGLLKRSQWEATAFGYKGPFYKNLTPPMPTWG